MAGGLKLGNAWPWQNEIFIMSIREICINVFTSKRNKMKLVSSGALLAAHQSNNIIS
jgi:hypothetical protein